MIPRAFGELCVAAMAFLASPISGKLLCQHPCRHDFSYFATQVAYEIVGFRVHDPQLFITHYLLRDHPLVCIFASLRPATASTFIAPVRSSLTLSNTLGSLKCMAALTMALTQLL